MANPALTPGDPEAEAQIHSPLEAQLMRACMFVLKCEGEGIINNSLWIPKGKRQSPDLESAED